MIKSAYLVLTDLHLDFSKANRINYFQEILNALVDIQKIAASYQNRGYDPYAIFLGDVFDGSLNNPAEAMQAIEIMRYFCSSFKKTWSVVGNHEITFAQNNPFWFLVSEIGDSDLASICRYVQPRGLSDVFTITDKFTDGNVTFYFNHFSTPAKIPIAEGVRIGFFHHNVGSNDICKMWGTFDNVEDASYIQGYNYCFFGHLHLAKGKFFLNEEHTCQGEWLGTIGRTKVTEVSVDDRSVNIPAILIEDALFSSIEDNFIELPTPAECIDFKKLEASQRSKKIIEEHRQTSTSSYKGETLYQTLQGSFGDSSLGFLLDFLSNPWEDVLRSYNHTLRNIDITNEEGDTK